MGNVHGWKGNYDHVWIPAHLSSSAMLMAFGVNEMSEDYEESNVSLEVSFISGCKRYVDIIP